MQQVTELFRYHFNCRIVALLETKLCGFKLVPKPIKRKPKDKYYIVMLQRLPLTLDLALVEHPDG